MIVSRRWRGSQTARSVKGGRKLVERLRTLSVIAALTAYATAAYAVERVDKIEAILAWTLYADSAATHDICFISAVPKSSIPDGASRDAPRAYLTAWPKERVKAEVSFRMGFPVNPTSEPTALIGLTEVKLFNRDDRLYVVDAAQETRLVEAMKRGTDIRVVATSERGTKVTDIYSLGGFSQAFAKLQSLCG